MMIIIVWAKKILGVEKRDKETDDIMKKAFVKANNVVKHVEKVNNEIKTSTAFRIARAAGIIKNG